MLGEVVSCVFSSNCNILSITIWLINTWYIFVPLFQDTWDGQIRLSKVETGAGNSGLWYNRLWFDRSLLASHDNL